MVINLTIPDASAGQIVDGLCAATGWAEASGMKKEAWANEKLVLWLKETAKRGLLKTSQATISKAIDPVAITYDAINVGK